MEDSLAAQLVEIIFIARRSDLGVVVGLLNFLNVCGGFDVVGRVDRRILAVWVFGSCVYLLANEFFDLLARLLLALAAASCRVHGTVAPVAVLVVDAKRKIDGLELCVRSNTYDNGVLPMQRKIETRVLLSDVALDLVPMKLGVEATFNDA